MNLSILPSADLWRLLNPLSSKYEVDEKRRSAIVAELRSRHRHLATNTSGVVQKSSNGAPISVISSIPYPWEALHL
jgi:hypothetical protein